MFGNKLLLSGLSRIDESLAGVRDDISSIKTTQARICMSVDQNTKDIKELELKPMRYLKGLSAAVLTLAAGIGTYLGFK